MSRLNAVADYPIGLVVFSLRMELEQRPVIWHTLDFTDVISEFLSRKSGRKF